MMKNKWNCNVNVILAKRRCIKNIFTKKTRSGIAHSLVSMLPGCGCTGTSGVAALWVNGSVGCVCVQAKGDV
jgi:agmatine/peptidylarginine deiminase